MEVIDSLPPSMRDDALVPWKDAAALCGYGDPEYCRKIITEAGVPLVNLSERRRLPRWGALREYLRSRETQ
jgi:hypothetical protein